MLTSQLVCFIRPDDYYFVWICGKGENNNDYPWSLDRIGFNLIP
jgi:hypothetical protein